MENISHEDKVKFIEENGWVKSWTRDIYTGHYKYNKDDCWYYSIDKAYSIEMEKQMDIEIDVDLEDLSTSACHCFRTHCVCNTGEE
jgi:hypothetical protein